MKKLLKSVICGSMNNARIHCSLWKVNICGYCSMNSNRITPKCVKTKQKKNENAASQTQTQLQWNPNGHYITLKFNKISVFFFFMLFSLKD